MYVEFPNVFTVDGDEKITGEESFLYYQLCLDELKWESGKIKTSIDLLSCSIQMRKEDRANKLLIVSLLRSMRAKNIIMFQDVESKKAKYKTDVPLIINKHPIKFYTTGRKQYMKGFEQIDYEIFRNINENVSCVNKGNYFLICCYIQKVKREVSYSELSNVIGYTEKQVRNIVDSMVELKMINKMSGRYIVNSENQMRQEPNRYEVLDVLPENDKSDNVMSEYIMINMYEKKKWIKQKFDVQTLIDETFNWESNLYYQHYYYSYKYQGSDVRTFKQYLKRRKALEKGGFDFTSYDKQFNDEVEKECRKREKEMESKRNAVKLIGDKGKVYVDQNNVDDLDLRRVSEIYYLNDGILSSGDIYKFANIKYDSLSDMSDSDVLNISKVYTGVVKSGKMIALEDIYKIREMCSIG